MPRVVVGFRNEYSVTDSPMMRGWNGGRNMCPFSSIVRMPASAALRAAAVPVVNNECRRQRSDYRSKRGVHRSRRLFLGYPLTLPKGRSRGSDG
jgi:hypothetical protein